MGSRLHLIDILIAIRQRRLEVRALTFPAMYRSRHDVLGLLDTPQCVN